jgi:hypothetical protein
MQGQIVRFCWRIEPATNLYRQNHFTLHFPQWIDLSRVPNRLWWDVFLMCLHAHWLLLRPCTVYIPIHLGAAERQFWLQLLRNAADTIDAYGPRNINPSQLGIEIIDNGVEMRRTVVHGLGYGTAFSGGKDSLLQTGLLAELTEKPLLVTTTSPLPPLTDHETARRAYILTAIQERRDINFVEVRSDFRATWDNGYASRIGYSIAVNELTDTFLYTACLVLAGAALGVTRLFLASEAEVQENISFGNKIVQHSHFMYSAATQRALARLISSYGLRFGSLLWPLHSMQVQELLWARYPDLCDLQYSCWKVAKDEKTCSRCGQCLRIAMTAMAAGHDPQRMGIDLPKILEFASQLDPAARDPARAVLPSDLVMSRFHALVLDAIRRTSLRHVAYLLAQGDIRRMFSHSTLNSLGLFLVARRRAKHAPTPPKLGVREAFFDWLDPDLRDRLIAIYCSYFVLEPRGRHLPVFERNGALAARASACLDRNNNVQGSTL